MEFRLLRADEIEVRTASVKDKGCQFLIYKNARCDMNILDETVGPDKWQRKHYECKGNLFCSVGIKCGDEWIWKDDCGAESQAEAEKGEASDSFKRACFNWGIGRELYTKIFIWINRDLLDFKTVKGKEQVATPIKVLSIEYNDQRLISKLVLANSRTGQVLYTYGEKAPAKFKTSDTPRVYKCWDCGKEFKEAKGQTAEHWYKASQEMNADGKARCSACMKKLKEANNG